MAKMLTSIAGVAYRPGARDVLNRLNKGHLLELRREPDNPHDRNAVAVYTRGGMPLGYVPRQDAPAIAKVLDLEYPIATRMLGNGGARIEISWSVPTPQQSFMFE